MLKIRGRLINNAAVIIIIRGIENRRVGFWDAVLRLKIHRFLKLILFLRRAILEPNRFITEALARERLIFVPLVLGRRIL